MKTSNNTILITGGGSGIGFEMAKRLSPDNRIILTGRKEEKLKAAVAQLSHATYIVGDVSDAADVDRLTERLFREFPELNVVVNNAGVVNRYNVAAENANAYTYAGEEMLVNYLSVVRLNEKLLPLLRQQAESAIVNVTSTFALVPNPGTAGYGASKMALRSYTLALRMLLEDSSVKVFELLPPYTDTEFIRKNGKFDGIPASVVVDDLVNGLANDLFEILVGESKTIYDLYLESPEKAINFYKIPKKA